MKMDNYPLKQTEKQPRSFSACFLVSKSQLKVERPTKKQRWKKQHLVMSIASTLQAVIDCKGFSHNY